MNPDFIQLEFMNEIFTPHEPPFPILNSLMKKHKNDAFHFIIGGFNGISADNIRITDKSGNIIENVIWEPIDSDISQNFQLIQKENGIYSIESCESIFISTKAKYFPCDYTVSLKLNSVKEWFYFCISLSGAEDSVVLSSQKQHNKKAAMLIVPEKRSNRISFWNNYGENEWVINRTNFDWTSQLSLSINKTGNGEWNFILDGDPISNMGNKLTPDSHHCYELSYVQSGSGYMTIDGKNHYLDTDNFVLIKPNSVHSFKSNTACRLISMRFFYDNSRGILGNTFIGKSEEISKIIMQIDQELKQTPNNYENIVQSYLKLILFTLIRTQKTLFASNKENAIFQNVIAEIKGNFTKQIDMEKLAETVGYSYHRFRHLFKSIFGMSVKQYITELRLHYALQLLRDTNLSAKEISACCGFTSLAALTDTVKKNYGLTPSDYRLSEESFFEIFR